MSRRSSRGHARAERTNAARRSLDSTDVMT
jgi:hypothetical protein